MDAHQFLIDKGVNSIKEQRGVHTIQKWLTEFGKSREALKANVLDNLINTMVADFRSKGDTVMLQTLCMGKSQYTGNELADEIENGTEFGQELVNNLVLLTIDLVARGKETLPMSKPLPPPNRFLREGDEPPKQKTS